MNPHHISEHIILPALVALAEFDERMNTSVAVDLLMGTAAQESRLGHYLVQKGGGPAKGIFQMEGDTHRSLWEFYINRKGHEKLRVIMLDFVPSNCIKEGIPNEKELIYHPVYAAAMTRVHYWQFPDSIPDNLEGQAGYWKRHYNTERGHGTVIEYIQRYKELVA